MKSKLQYIKQALDVVDLKQENTFNDPVKLTLENTATSPYTEDFGLYGIPSLYQPKELNYSTHSLSGKELEPHPIPTGDIPGLTPTWGDKAWDFAKDNTVPLGLGAGALGLGYLGYKALTDDSEEEKERKRRRRHEDKYAMDQSNERCVELYFDELQHNLRSVSKKVASKSIWQRIIESAGSERSLVGATIGVGAGAGVGVLNKAILGDSNGNIAARGLIGGIIGGAAGTAEDMYYNYKDDKNRENDDAVNYNGHIYNLNTGEDRKIAAFKGKPKPPTLWDRIVQSAVSPTAMMGATTGAALGIAHPFIGEAIHPNEHNTPLMLAGAGVAFGGLGAVIGGGLGFTQDFVGKAYQRSVNQEAKRRIMEAGRYQEIAGDDDEKEREEVKKLQLAAAGAKLPDENISSNSNNSPNSIYSLFKNL